MYPRDNDFGVVNLLVRVGSCSAPCGTTHPWPLSRGGHQFCVVPQSLSGRFAVVVRAVNRGCVYRF